MATEGRRLAKVRDLASQREALNDELESVSQRLADAVRELADDGVPIAKLAREAKVSRQTVAVWLGRDGWDKRYRVRTGNE